MIGVNYLRTVIEINFGAQRGARFVVKAGINGRETDIQPSKDNVGPFEEASRS
jgi:hypothetical protein